MKTLIVQSEISRDGKLKVEVPCELPPGPVEVELTVRTRLEVEAARRPPWAMLYGLGKEVWAGVDPTEYVAELRQDREGPP
jgi:hypothetical protein